jgi:hypothetical protein
MPCGIKILRGKNFWAWPYNLELVLSNDANQTETLPAGALRPFRGQGLSPTGNAKCFKGNVLDYDFK